METNYFLKSDLVIENILKENSIDFTALNIGGTNGIILDRSSLNSMETILKKTFVTAAINFLGPTSYEGICKISVRYEEYDEEYEIDEDEEFETDDKLLEEIRNIDAEITRLRNIKYSIERKIKNIAIESIQEDKEYSGIIL